MKMTPTVYIPPGTEASFMFDLTGPLHGCVCQPPLPKQAWGCRMTFGALETLPSWVFSTIKN